MKKKITVMVLPLIFSLLLFGCKREEKPQFVVSTQIPEYIKADKNEIKYIVDETLAIQRQLYEIVNLENEMKIVKMKGLIDKAENLNLKINVLDEESLKITQQKTSKAISKDINLGNGNDKLINELKELYFNDKKFAELYDLFVSKFNKF